MILRFLPFIWRNLWRNKRRSILTILGSAVAIFVFIALNAAVDGMTFPLKQVGDSQLLNVREAGRSNVLTSRIPQAYVDRVRSLDVVKDAAGVLNELAVIGSQGVHIFIRGVLPDEYFRVQPIEIDPGAWEMFSERRSGALVGFRLMAQMGWEVGSEIEIASIGLRLTIVGKIPKQGIDLESHMLVHQEYLQNLRSAEGQISYVLAAPAEDQSPNEVARIIDEYFQFLPATTETASEQGFAEELVADFVGFLDYLKVMGVIAVLITMLAAANAIAMNVRERTKEIGTLKAIGFSPGLILTIVISEATLLSLIGGAIGIFASVMVLGSDNAQVTGIFISSSNHAYAAVLSLLIGFAGGFVPAVNAARLKTVDALNVIG